MMSLEEAEKILQIAHGADFDTILRAKEKLLSKSKEDDDRKFEVSVVVRDRGTSDPTPAFSVIGGMRCSDLTPSLPYAAP